MDFKGKDNLFKTTFLISLFFHALVLLPIPKLKISQNNTEPYLKMRYLKIISTAKTKKIAVEAHKVSQKKSTLQANRRKNKVIRTARKKIRKKTYKKKPIKLKNAKISAEKINTIPKIEEKKVFTKKTPAKEKITKDKNYISYYKLINELLRQSVIYPQNFSEGEVAVSFVLTSDGTLKSVKVLQDTSPYNVCLRETAVQIVKNASPFPPFPKELQQMQLTFSIVICFRERS